MTSLETDGTIFPMQAKKSLGQNFLKNDTIIQKIVSLFICDKNDLIIEIGPGRGALTKQLISLDATLKCIEIDKDMQPYLAPLNVEVFYEDILKFDLDNIISFSKYENIYIIGNLPYYITSPIIEKLLKLNQQVDKMVFMVQKEVAQRLCAKPQSKEYGYMTILANHFYDVKYEFTVTKENFNPVPKVDSAIISFNKKNILPVPNDFFSFLKIAFAHKRKTLKNNLANYDNLLVKKIFQELKLDDNTRAEELSEDILLEIYNKLK